MQVVRAIIDFEAVLLAVERKPATADTVAITANESAQKRLRTLDTVLDVVMPLDNIGHHALFVGNHDGHK